MRRRSAGRRRGDDRRAGVADASEPAGQVVAVSNGWRLGRNAIESVVAEGNSLSELRARAVFQNVAVGIIGEGIGTASRIADRRQPVEPIIEEIGSIVVGVGELARTPSGV